MHSCIYTYTCTYVCACICKCMYVCYVMYTFVKNDYIHVQMRKINFVFLTFLIVLWVRHSVIVTARTNRDCTTWKYCCSMYVCMYVCMNACLLLYKYWATMYICFNTEACAILIYMYVCLWMYKCSVMSGLPSPWVAVLHPERHTAIQAIMYVSYKSRTDMNMVNANVQKKTNKRFFLSNGCWGCMKTMLSNGWLLHTYCR